MPSNKNVLFSYGVGGHNAQMNRLAAKLTPHLLDYKIISISDNKNKPDWSCTHYVTGEVRSKHSHIDILFNSGPLRVIKTLLQIKGKHKHIDVVVSTGPGISLFSAFFFKFFGAKIIHVETWSRFYSKSLTGKIMYLISDKFYVQNESLKKIYPNSIYSGVL